jgi:serine phosphatase RsbU (regulator of sigma subunit)
MGKLAFLNMNNLRSCLLSFCFLFYTLCAAAPLQERIVILENADTFIPLGKWIDVYADKTGKLTIQDILKPEIRNRFIPSKVQNPSFGITSAAYWAHFKIKNNLPVHDNWVLQGPSIMDKMDVFFTDDNQNILEKKGGGLIPLQKREFKNRKILFKLPTDTYVYEFDVYVRFESQRQMAIPMTLWNFSAFADSDRIEMYVLGIYFGILLVMIFYNLFLFFSLKDISYLYYVLYITFFGLSQFFEHGFALEFMGSWMVPFNKHIHLSLNVLTMIVAINFSRHFLNSSKQAPRLDKLLVLYTVLSCVILVFIAANKITWALKFGNPLIICSIVTLLALCFICVKNRYRPVRYFLIGWFALMCGIVLYILKTLGVAPYNFFTVYGMQIASAFEVLLFSLALADRINDIKREQARFKDQVNRELEIKVEERTREIGSQKGIIEQKNKDITDSINYAQRIQQAILPLKEDIRKTLPDSFILYKPRDIVSGDFYWFSEITKETGPKGENSQHIMIAASDCTGHGVPGAFMSMIGTSQLHKIINEKGIITPGEILDGLNEGVRQALKQDKDNAQNRDGMDIALCALEFVPAKDDNALVKGVVATLQYAGAYRPLYLIRDGVLQEIKPDKYPIGGRQDAYEKKFTNHVISLYKGDTLYIFTDGYVDQFGGEGNRKFMINRFRQELLNLQALPMKDQENVLDKMIVEWMLGTEQIDDILVIGIRL